MDKLIFRLNLTGDNQKYNVDALMNGPGAVLTEMVATVLTHDDEFYKVVGRAMSAATRARMEADQAVHELINESTKSTNTQ